MSERQGKGREPDESGFASRSLRGAREEGALGRREAALREGASSMETPPQDDPGMQSRVVRRLRALEEENLRLRGENPGLGEENRQHRDAAPRLRRHNSLQIRGGGRIKADMTNVELSHHLMRNTDFYRQFCERVDPCLLLPSLALPAHLEGVVKNASTYDDKQAACQLLWVYLRRESEWPEKLARALSENPSTADLGQMVRESKRLQGLKPSNFH